MQISSANFVLISTSKLFKNNKIARVRRVSAILQEKLQEKSCYFLLIMYIKSITESQDRQKFGERARAIFNLHSCYTDTRFHPIRST